MLLKIFKHRKRGQAQGILGQRDKADVDGDPYGEVEVSTGPLLKTNSTRLVEDTNMVLGIG